LPQYVHVDFTYSLSDYPGYALIRLIDYLLVYTTLWSWR